MQLINEISSHNIHTKNQKQQMKNMRWISSKLEILKLFDSMFDIIILMTTYLFKLQAIKKQKFHFYQFDHFVTNIQVRHYIILYEF